MSDNKKYYWLRLKEDFFNEKQVKYLRSLPDGDKLVIVYLKMQLKSLKTEGFIKYDRILPSYSEELAIVLDEDVNIVKLAVNALIQAKAVEELDDGSLYIIAMQDLIGKEGESAERVRKFRQKQKTLLLQCNSEVTKCNTEIEKEIEKEIKIDYNSIIEIYNFNCPNLPQVKKITDKRKRIIKTFLKEFTEEQFTEICKIANNNNFLTGKNDRGWKADFDFLMRVDKATSILEGKYGTSTKENKTDILKELEEELNNEN